MSRSCFCLTIFVWFYDPLHLKREVILDCFSYVDEVNAVLTGAACPCGQLELWECHPEDFEVVWEIGSAGWTGVSQHSTLLWNVVLLFPHPAASCQCFAFPTHSLHIVLSLTQAVPVPKCLPNNSMQLCLVLIVRELSSFKMSFGMKNMEKSTFRGTALFRNQFALTDSSKAKETMLSFLGGILQFTCCASDEEGAPWKDL